MIVTGDVGGAEVELGTVVREEWLVTAAFILGQYVDLGLELGVWGDAAGLGKHLATLDLVLVDTTEQSADVVASLTVSSSLRNISTPVQVVVWVSRIPMISMESPVLTMPCSTLPVTTVPRPVIENTSSIGIRNGLSRSRSGVGM